MKKQTKQTINGKEYTFQKVSAMEFIRIKERSTDDKGIMRDSLFFEEMAEHVIIEPKIDLELFDDVQELDDIMKAATFLHIGKKR